MFYKYYKVPALSDIYHTLTAESVLGTCSILIILVNSDATEKWWNWPHTNTDIRIGAALILPSFQSHS